MKTIEELKQQYEGEILTSKQILEIDENPNVDEVEECGSSGRYINYFLYCVHFTDGTEMNIYF